VLSGSPARRNPRILARMSGGAVCPSCRGSSHSGLPAPNPYDTHATGRQRGGVVGRGTALAATWELLSRIPSSVPFGWGRSVCCDAASCHAVAGGRAARFGLAYQRGGGGPRSAPISAGRAVACDVGLTPLLCRAGQTAAAVSFVGCHHLPLVDSVGHYRGGLRCVARHWWIGAGRGWAQPLEARPTNRGRRKAHPVAGGAGGRRRGRSAAHKMASTSANNWITSWSRRRRARSDTSLLTAVGATWVCVIATTCFVHRPIRR
jgi:hypothetical protein